VILRERYSSSSKKVYLLPVPEVGQPKSRDSRKQKNAEIKRLEAEIEEIDNVLRAT